MEASLRGILQHLFHNFAAGRKLPLEHHQAVQALMRCGTEAMGHHHVRCAADGYEAEVVHSCRHRSCPRCNGALRHAWLEGLKGRLLGCGHYHVILTLPHELIPLWRFNRAWFAATMFKLASETLRQLLGDARYLGAEPGMVLSLHTWGRTLNVHPHVHCLVTGGGLRGDEWIEARKDFLLPVRVLKALYRGKWLARLNAAKVQGELKLPRDWSDGYFVRVMRRLAKKTWNARIERRYGHGKGVAIYLSRYVRGGPISDRRIEQADGETVSFRYASHRTGRTERMTLSATQFMARILTHVPVPGRHLVRYYGLYVPKAEGKRQMARALLGEPVTEETPTKARVTATCPRCGGELRRGPRLGHFKNSYLIRSDARSVQQGVEVDAPTQRGSPDDGGYGLSDEKFFPVRRPLN